MLCWDLTRPYHIILPCFLLIKTSNALQPRVYFSRAQVCCPRSTTRINSAQLPVIQRWLNIPTPSEQNEIVDCSHRITWSPLKSLLSTGLAVAFVFTGVVPRVEWRYPSNVRESMIRESVVTTAIGVTGANAMDFNDEQRIIAETWVSSSYQYRRAMFIWKIWPLLHRVSRVGSRMV